MTPDRNAAMALRPAPVDTGIVFCRSDLPGNPAIPARALNVTPKPPALMKALNTLGQPLFNPSSPEGFHDDASTWLAPDAMTNRLDIAQSFAQQADSSADARLVADAILGDAQSPETREEISRAEGPVQGLSILLMSPEFQRR